MASANTRVIYSSEFLLSYSLSGVSDFLCGVILESNSAYVGSEISELLKAHQPQTLFGPVLVSVLSGEGK